MQGKIYKSARLTASKIEVKANLDTLFLIEHEIAKATPTLLQLGTKEKLLEFLTSEPRSYTWLWTDKNGVNVGYLTLIDKEEHGELEVLAIRVLPGHQNSGCGKEMMAFAEKIAKKNGRAKVTLVTIASLESFTTLSVQKVASL